MQKFYPTQRAGVLTTITLFVTLSMGCSTSLRSWCNNQLKVGPNYSQPSVSSEVEWIDVQNDDRISAEEPDLACWWYSLNDPVLNDLIDETISQNLTLREAGSRINQARAIQGIAIGNIFPQVQQATGEYNRVQNSRNVAVPVPIEKLDLWSLGASAAWELDFWGRFRRSVDVADANLDAAIADYDDLLVILTSSVASTYVEIRTLQERLRITRNIIELQQGSLEIADTRFQARKTNKLDVLQAENNVDVTQSAIPPLEAQLRIANNRLCVLLAIPPEDLVKLLPPGPLPSVDPELKVGIPVDLLRRRPDIRRSERLLKAQSERIGIAEADLYPRISLIGSFEWQAEDIEDIFDSNSVFALVSPGFSWNILNYGRIRNGVELERQRFYERVYGYQQSILVAQQEVEDSIVSFLRAQEQTQQLVEAVEKADEAEEIVRTLYQTGAADFNRVFLIQATQFAQQDNLVVSRANEVLSLIKVYRALGGGWQCPSPNQCGMPAIEVENSGIAQPPFETVQDQNDAGEMDEIREMQKPTE